MSNCDKTCVLPEVSFSLCKEDIKTSGIGTIYIGQNGNPIGSEAGIAELRSRATLGSVDPEAVRCFIGSGFKPKPDVIKRWASLNRNAVINKHHAITFRVYDLNPVNLIALNALSNMGYNFTLWYVTGGMMLFGGTDGIPVSIDANPIIPDGANEVIYWEIDILWKSCGTENAAQSQIEGAPPFARVRVDSLSIGGEILDLHDDSFYFDSTGNPAIRQVKWNVYINDEFGNELASFDTGFLTYGTPIVGTNGTAEDLKFIDVAQRDAWVLAESGHTILARQQVCYDIEVIDGLGQAATNN